MTVMPIMIHDARRILFLLDSRRRLVPTLENTCPSSQQLVAVARPLAKLMIIIPVVSGMNLRAVIDVGYHPQL